VSLQRVTGSPQPSLARALAEFERGFRYPLGPGRSFRIDHGDDYTRFFRAMGEAACFVAERDGRVVGAVSAALRPVWAPDGAQRRACYIGDLKLAVGGRGGVILLRLMESVAGWAGGRADVAYAVVMDGTAVIPTAYTGRLGLPRFEAVAQASILRIVARPPTRAADGVRVATLDEVASCFRELSRGRFAVPPGQPALRSRRTPVGLMRTDGGACAVLEDTLVAKRLWADDGAEIVSAHLTALAFRTPEAGAEVVAEALGRCAASGVEAVFAAVAPDDTARLLAMLGVEGTTVAPATVYAAGLEPGTEWNLSSAEV